MKTTTKFAIAAAVTALMGSAANAADLGGSCCADLEERIAELEATTVRKGNRKVSLKISGFVGHQVMWWDDGTQTDTYFGDGGNIYSRWRFTGSAKITPDLEAGFTYEFGLNNTAIGSMNQGNGGDDLGECTNSCIRDTTVYLKHKRLGMLKIGQGSTATDNLVLIDLGQRSAAGTMDIGLYNGGFVLRNGAGQFGPLNGAAPAALGTWANAIRGHESWDTSRRNHVMYETPTLAGFSVQAAVAEDNYWDVALRYAGEFNGVRVAFGIGYQEDTEFNKGAGPTAGAATITCTNNCDTKTSDLKGSASILHVPTGLFLTGAYGHREVDGTGAAYTGPDLNAWHLSGGLNRNFFGIGNTVLFAEYSESKGGLEQAAYVTNSTLAPLWSGTEVTEWGLGINQYIDAAAMQVFLTYKNYQFDGRFQGVKQSSDFDAVIGGMRIDF